MNTMPVLTSPPIRNQVSTNDRDRFELCGETCVASALGESVETVVGWLRAHEGERFVQNGTSGESLVAYCASRGVSARIVYGRAADFVSAGVQRAHYSVVLVWSDHAGVPIPQAASQRLHVGGIGHWMLGYGVDGANVHLLQPFGGTLVTINLDGGQDQHFGVEIYRTVAAVSAPAPKPAPKPAAQPATTRRADDPRVAEPATRAVEPPGGTTKEPDLEPVSTKERVARSRAEPR
jgi:hypothetical protein